MFRPKMPEFDVGHWRTLPFPQRLTMICRSWASQGYGTPGFIFAVYGLKLVLYVSGWWLSCYFSGITDGGIYWWATVDAFVKAIVWTMLFEGLGFGCGSGPLTGRYMPPVGGFLYFLRLGTTKLPLFPEVPLLGGNQRNALDVLGYASTLTLLLACLWIPSVPVPWLGALIVAILVLGVLDTTLFLVFRSEHYLSVLVCLLFVDQGLMAAKWVWLAIWFWAAVSKLTRHFPYVMCVMVSNAFWTAYIPGLRRAMYRNIETDLRPSGAAVVLAHTGTLLEFGIPLMLLFGPGGTVLWVLLGVIAVFHLFILVNFPMGVPLEWNLMMIYGACALFGVHADESIWAVSAPALVCWLVGFHVLIPIAGSLWPSRISFLLAMRYYAGNWAYSAWLFSDGAEERLDAHLVKSSSLIPKQLLRFYEEETVEVLMSKVTAFRMMHLHGRALHALIPEVFLGNRTVCWYDGELVAGLTLGWNFGDGHLHRRQLLQAIQAQCGFAPGELRCVFVESQPWFSGSLGYSIEDAADGIIRQGRVDVAPLCAAQPWTAQDAN